MTTADENDYIIPSLEALYKQKNKNKQKLFSRPFNERTSATKTITKLLENKINIHFRLRFDFNFNIFRFQNTANKNMIF